MTVTELRLEIAAAETYVYPETMEVCGGIAYAEGHRDMIGNPSVVVEGVAGVNGGLGSRREVLAVAAGGEFAGVWAGVAGRNAGGVVYTGRRWAMILPEGGGAGGSLPVEGAES